MIPIDKKIVGCDWRDERTLCDDCIDDANQNQDLDPCIAFCYLEGVNNRPCGDCVDFSNIIGGVVTVAEAQACHTVAVKLAIIRNHGREHFDSLMGE